MCRKTSAKRRGSHWVWHVNGISNADDCCTFSLFLLFSYCRKSPWYIKVQQRIMEIPMVHEVQQRIMYCCPVCILHCCPILARFIHHQDSDWKWQKARLRTSRGEGTSEGKKVLEQYKVKSQRVGFFFFAGIKDDLTQRKIWLGCHAHTICQNQTWIKLSYKMFYSHVRVSRIHKESYGDDGLCH